MLVIVVCLTGLSCRQKDVKDELYYINGDTLSISEAYYDKMTDAEKMQLFIDKGIGNYIGKYSFKPSHTIRTSSQYFLYQFIAANKYDDTDAQTFFEDEFCDFFPIIADDRLNLSLDLNYLDPDTRKFILDNLWEAYKHNDVDVSKAAYKLSNLYAIGNGVKKDIEFSKYLYHRYDSISKIYKHPNYDEKWLKIIIK
jgi:hypothetical protein